MLLGVMLIAGVMCGIVRTAAAEDEVQLLPASLEVSGQDLSLRQERKGDCKQGKNCEYLITVTNEGPAEFDGVLNILRTSSYRPGRHKSQDDVSCSRNRASIACRTEPLQLAAGQSFAFTLSMPVPRWLSGEVEKCAVISFSGGEFEDPLEDLVAIVQLALKSRDFYGNGDVDGKVGKKLNRAIAAFRKEQNMAEGDIDTELLKALFGPAGLVIANTNPKNDHACDRFELGKPPATRTRRRAVRQRGVRRAAATRQNETRSRSTRNSVNGRANPRLFGLD